MLNTTFTSSQKKRRDGAFLNQVNLREAPSEDLCVTTWDHLDVSLSRDETRDRMPKWGMVVDPSCPFRTLHLFFLLVQFLLISKKFMLEVEDMLIG